MDADISEHELTGFKYLDRLLPLLKGLHAVGCARDRAGNRRLHYDHYCLLLLLALFTLAGGIYLEGNLHDSVLTNTLLLAIGTVLASIIGTTGAAMILIRPLIRANDDRRYNGYIPSTMHNTKINFPLRGCTEGPSLRSRRIDMMRARGTFPIACARIKILSFGLAR